MTPTTKLDNEFKLKNNCYEQIIYNADTEKFDIYYDLCALVPIQRKIMLDGGIYYDCIIESIKIDKYKTKNGEIVDKALAVYEII